MNGKKGKLEKFWEDLAKPRDVRKHLINNPKKIVVPEKEKSYNYDLKSDSVDRFEKYFKGMDEKALVYRIETERKKYVKNKENTSIIPQPTILYCCFENYKEQLQIHGLDSGAYRLSSWQNLDDEILKNERDTWISSQKNFMKSGNRGILELVNYINPGTNFLNPKFNG